MDKGPKLSPSDTLSVPMGDIAHVDLPNEATSYKVVKIGSDGKPTSHDIREIKPNTVDPNLIGLLRNRQPT